MSWRDYDLFDAAGRRIGGVRALSELDALWRAVHRAGIRGAVSARRAAP